MNTKSIHSPKSPFRVEINFHKYVKGLGSVQSFTACSLEQATDLAVQAVKTANTMSNARILQNIAQPTEAHNWKEVVSYVISNDGVILTKHNKL